MQSENLTALEQSVQRMQEATGLLTRVTDSLKQWTTAHPDAELPSSLLVGLTHWSVMNATTVIANAISEMLGYLKSHVED